MAEMIREPSRGPVVGHTTASSVRLWARASDIDKNRTIGIAALYRKNGRYIGDTIRYFRLRREYDRTGWVDFDGLDADTEYQVRIGSIRLDTPQPMSTNSNEELLKKLPDAKVWREELEKLDDRTSLATFRSFPEKADAGFSFVFGSCRYPGFKWDHKRSDRIYDAIYQRCSDETTKQKPRFAMMVGDQIYADMLNRHIPIGRADTEEEFRDRYLDAFGTPNMRKLLSSTPTYMMLDDHEIEDNWSDGRIKKNASKRELYLIAMKYYRSYQWLHGPQTYGKDPLYYSFDFADYPFFVTDQRTKRLREDFNEVSQMLMERTGIARFKDWGQALEDHHLLGRPKKSTHESYTTQIDQLCGWLKKMQEDRGDVPKFIVSPSVFAPNTVDSARDDMGKFKDDAWAAFPKTRATVLSTIVENSVQNVVFLSGDIHCSNCARIHLKAANGRKLPLRIYDVTSSAFYWPYSFADGDPEGYVHDSVSEKDGFRFTAGNGKKLVMHYTAEKFQQADNFTQIDVSQDKLVVRTFDKDGKSLDTTHLPLV